MTAQRIDGSVIRQTVCQPVAPSVFAACSCSSPTSRSVGMTSRATNGSETKIVAMTIDGSEKSTWIPWRSNQPPNQPSLPYSRKSERPTTTGESASGRSISTLSRPLPGDRGGTITSPQTNPEAGVTGTPAPALISVVLYDLLG